MVTFGFPLVSIIVTTKNRELLLQRAINSILNQSYPNIEIIVVDDGSSDGTRDLILNHYPNIKYIRNDESRGACFSRNIGIKSAKGEYISGLDDDDEYHQDRITVLMESLINTNYCLSCCHALNKYNTGMVVKEPSKKEIITYRDLLKANLIGSQVLVKRDKLMSIGGFDESLVASQDHDMWFRLLMNYGKAIKVKDYLYNCYIDETIDRVSKNKIKGAWQFYRKHHKHMSVYDCFYNFLRMSKMLLWSCFS